MGPRSELLIKLNDEILNQFFFIQEASPQLMLLGTACQLARVARWCFSDVMLSIVINLLETYLNEPNDDRCLDALRRPV
jgi:hypothetical protein